MILIAHAFLSLVTRQLRKTGGAYINSLPLSSTLAALDAVVIGAGNRTCRYGAGSPKAYV
jgi:hypothetical protein